MSTPSRSCCASTVIALPGGEGAEIRATHVGILKEVTRGPLADHPPALEDVGAPGETKGGAHVLLDEEDGDAGPVDRRQGLEDRFYYSRSQAQGWLVEHEQARRRHQGAGERDHLLLTARQRSGELAAALVEGGEEPVHALEARLLHGARARREGAEREILLDGHLAEETAPLGDEGQAVLHDLVRMEREKIARVPADRARPRLEQPGDTLEQRALPGAVGADERDDLAGGHVEGRVREGGEIAV